MDKHDWLAVSLAALATVLGGVLGAAWVAWMERRLYRRYGIPWRWRGLVRHSHGGCRPDGDTWVAPGNRRFPGDVPPVR